MRLFFIILCSFLTNCITLLPPSPPASQKVELQSKAHDYSFLQAVPWSLVIEEPSALNPYDTTQIILNIEQESGLHHLRPCGEIQWADRLPFLVQQKIIQGFEKSQKIQGVGARNENFVADYVVQLNLHKAEIEFKENRDNSSDIISISDKIEAVLDISAKLIDQKSGRIIAQKNFAYRIPCLEKTKKEFIKGFENALSALIHDLVKWTLTRPFPSLKPLSLPDPK